MALKISIRDGIFGRVREELKKELGAGQGFSSRFGFFSIRVTVSCMIWIIKRKRMKVIFLISLIIPYSKEDNCKHE